MTATWVGPQYWVQGKWIETVRDALDYAAKLAAGEQTSAGTQEYVRVYITDGTRPTAAIAHVGAA